MLSTARFMRQFLLAREASVLEEETTYRRNGELLPATLYRPRAARYPLPGWMTLHGLTYHGREHTALKRLARALSAAGAVVLVPDIPEWRALRVAPAAAVETIKAAVLALDGLGLTAAGRIGVVGFSFGATQALIAATDPALRGHLAGVASWGGYAEIETVAHFMFLGEHELDGRSYRLDPDPYGRWILAGNYLALLEDFDDGARLGEALLGLAQEAGRRKVMSWDPALDPVKARVRDALTAEHREVFDLIAPPTGTVLGESDQRRLRGLCDRMLEAAVATEPLLDPRPYLPRVPVQVFLAHGRHDRLIPWSELVRLRRALPPTRIASSGITGLFAHSGGERRLPTPAALADGVRFLVLMHRMLRLI
jgi:pimeloyl-ACP methyl ester carboxylesterase